MEGVTIIETITEHNISPDGIWCITICMLAFAGAIVFETYDSFKKKQYVYFAGMIGVILSCVFVIGLAWTDESFHYTKYVVSIDDSVNFNQFFEKYEIISKDGDEYVVREIDTLDVGKETFGEN